MELIYQIHRNISTEIEQLHLHLASYKHAHSVEKGGILLSRFLRKNWKKFRQNKTNAKLAQFTL